MEGLRQKFTNEDDNYENRKCTNINWIYLMILFFTLMFAFVTYSGVNSDLRRFTNGYDDCGYICGLKNLQRNDLLYERCEAYNKEEFPKVQVDGFSSKCVKECPFDYIQLMNRCVRQDEDSYDPYLTRKFDAIINDLALTSPTILLVCFLALIFSYILLLMFRHCAHYAVWGITILSVIMLIKIAGYFWYLFATSTAEMSRVCLDGAVIWTFLACVSLIVVICVRERIKLVVKLFKEAAKVLFDIPALMAQPIMTFIATALAVAPFIGFQILIETSGTLEVDPETSKVTLQQNGFIVTARILNIVGFVWFTQFLIGCQHFIIAGTVSKWYFTRDKAKLNAPMKSTYYNLFWFHLGSICLGSWIITIIKTIKIFLLILYWMFASSRHGTARLIAFIIHWIIEQLDHFFRYLIRNAYIIVAKDGLPFFKAASKSNDLIFNNLIDVLALNHVGDLVLTLGRLFVVGIAGYVGFEAMKGQTGVVSVFLPMFIAIILSFIIVHCLVTIFEMTIDTIFLCYCEDVESNDGSNEKPYFMSFGLKNVMEELKGFGSKLKNDKAPIIANEVTMANA